MTIFIKKKHRVTIEHTTQHKLKVRMSCCLTAHLISVFCESGIIQCFKIPPGKANSVGIIMHFKENVETIKI